jgi:glucosamine--fructose-6-phosphate aminotransferase (isomerizing)
MKHGPIALIDERMPVVAIAPAGAGLEKMIGNIQEVKARGASVIALTTNDDKQLRGVLDASNDVILELPCAPELLLPMAMALPLQLLAYHVAVHRGCDVDQPRNLAKSVTVE